MTHSTSLRGYIGAQKVVFLALVLSLILHPNCCRAWIPPASYLTHRHPLCHDGATTTLWAKKKKGSATKKSTGGGGGGFGAPAAAQPKTLNKKQVAKRITQKYGGTSAQDIARGTQQRIDEALKKQPNHVQVALQLYQQLQKWNARLDSLSVLEHAKLSPQDVDGARRAQEELDRILQENSLTTDDLHNVFQQATWDASADAKAARALTGKIPNDILTKVDAACRIVAEAVGSNGKCLDVGCGYGVLVPHLTSSGLDSSQIVGVDLSEEMIRNAREQHRGVAFEACDFAQYQTDQDFDAVIFCSSLHDLPNARMALKKAASLLRPQGKVVVAHPQGAAHVARQHSANPVMVQAKLPDAQQLKEMASEIGLEVEKEPSAFGSAQEEEEGYLAVLVKP